MIKLAEAAYLNACSFNSFEKLASNAARRAFTKGMRETAGKNFIAEFKSKFPSITSILEDAPTPKREKIINTITKKQLGGGYNTFDAHRNFMLMDTNTKYSPLHRSQAYMEDYAQNKAVSNQAKRFLRNRGEIVPENSSLNLVRLKDAENSKLQRALKVYNNAKHRANTSHTDHFLTVMEAKGRAL